MAQRRTSTASRPARPASGQFRAGRLVVDRERSTAALAGEPLALTPLEFETLARIVAGAGRVITYEALALALWDDPPERARGRLAVVISRLRAKLGPEAGLIDTVRPRGYRLSPHR